MSGRNTLFAQWTRSLRGLVLPVCLVAVSTAVMAEDRELRTFDRQELTDVYFSEGANAGDINGDGKMDIICGPYWFEGPEFKRKHEIYPAKPQNVNRYSNNFFSWVYDFDGDGHLDVMSVGLPNSDAVVYRNPGPDGLDKPWPKKSVLDLIGNESPQFIDIVGDDHPELICVHKGRFGYASPNWDKPLDRWKFTAVSEIAGLGRFTHGLGIGDVNGDDRLDIIWRNGWFEQPESPEDAPFWDHHEYLFARRGGADMFAYDVDGDGDNDVITSLAAHDFGVAWFEQVKEDGKISFKKHLIVGKHPSENRYGVLFSEPHALNFVDMDGDGLKDIITGKTYWSHHRQSAMWDAGAVVYVFKLVRTKDGVDWVPHKANGDSGIGRQLTIADVNGDKMPDIVVGGMKGANVLIQKKQMVDQATWDKAQPKPYQGPAAPGAAKGSAKRGARPSINPKSGKVVGALEIEDLKLRTSGGATMVQDMGKFRDGPWSGGEQLWWRGAKPGDKLTIDLPVKQAGEYGLALGMTRAGDYAVVRVLLDDKPLGRAIDLYSSKVEPTGVLKFPVQKLDAGTHKLTVKIMGANRDAAQKFMVGLDFVQLLSGGKNDRVATQTISVEDQRGPAYSGGVLPKGADGKPLNLDFEKGTLEHWTAKGAAFTNQPVRGDTVASRRKDMKSNHQGEFWIGGFEKKNDGAVGTLISDPFKVTERWATFLCNGGNTDKTRVEVVQKASGRVFFRALGNRRENLRPIVLDLDVFRKRGSELFIRIVDEGSGGWGHVNFDNFRLHKEQPGPVTSRSAGLKADEYPYAGLSGEEAARVMKLPEGFSVQSLASEPDVKQPIAMALDDRGRVWIAEAYEYPVRAKGDKGRDRILIFEDADGDGKFEKPKVFAEGLNLVSGLEVGFGGVWVGAAPYLMFIPDRDGDDVADGKPEILLDGWGYQDTHETLNAFTWGPDGWLYGCHGVFTHSNVGKPGAKDEDRTRINAGIWRYHPTRHEFEVFAHGTSNPWGVDFNDRGQTFCTACVIPHLFHMIQGARYHRQGGTHFNRYTYNDIKTIADHRHYLGATPHSGNNKSDEAGGGHAHAGAMIYLGGAWPDKYRDQIFMNNIHGQRINMDTLTAKGSGYVGGHGPDFILTGDKASQILNLRYGPDGQAIMIDWYDMQACHRREVEIHDRSNGRIYRIVYGDAKPVKVDLKKLSDKELVENALSDNDWYVRHARRILQERAAAGKLDKATYDRMREIATKNEDDTRRLRAMWMLHVTGGMSEEFASQLLTDSSPYVRGWAIQLAFDQDEKPSDAFVALMTEMAESDPSPVVRLYLASALQKMEPNKRWDILERLARHSEDANDHNLPLMYWYAAEPLVDEDPERSLAFAMSAGDSIPLLRRYMLRRIGSSGTSDSLALLVRGLGKAEEDSLRMTFLNGIRTSLRGQRQVTAPDSWSDVYASLSKSDSNEVRLQAMALGLTFGDEVVRREFRKLALSKSESEKDRRQAIRSLLATKDPKLAPTLKALLEEPALRDLAISSLAFYSDKDTPGILLEKYDSLSPREKRLVVATMCSRSSYGVALLNAIAKKDIPSSDISADLVRQLKNFKHKEIDRLLEDEWGSVRATAADKLKLIETYKKLVAKKEGPKPDHALGRAVFAKTCQRCHSLYGVGQKIGPDLTGSNRSDLNYLLSNIVDPSSVMAKEYQPVVVQTADGLLITGILRAKSKKALTLQPADSDPVIIPLDEIEEQMNSQQSMMPDDQLKQFTEHEVRSLVAYLRDKKQSPMLATKDTLDRLFNGKDLTGWTGNKKLWSVQDGEIVGVSAGLKRNEFLTSDMLVGDFKFTVDVKLTPNKGNSGIQFRSMPAKHGHVKGYQADIGVGWWGKLYEELGRGLLWKKSGEAHVKKGDWNTYVIQAKGSEIKTWINGQPCVDLDDPKGAKQGVFAFQLHSGGPMEVRFRNLKLELLDAKPKK